jgi:glucosylceramidase
MKKIFAIISLLAIGCSDSKNTTPTQSAEVWTTTSTRSHLLTKSTAALVSSPSGSVIEVDTSTQYQTMDGFGYALTGGSAMLINQKLSTSRRDSLLRELFSTDENAIAISYLRISIGASDLDDHVFSYDDLPAGQTDPDLKNFSLAEDQKNLIPILKQIKTINPQIKIMASPWSAPVWMKDNSLPKGGSLLKQYYPTYANYFVKYIQEMAKEGITIDAITIQNEPENPNNTPSLVMTAPEQNEFIRDHLGPAFQKNSIATKIILFDHNADHPEYPISILDDAKTKPFVDGSAFHLYLGAVEALSRVHYAHPDKNLYFTEQWTSGNGDFGGDLKWHVKNLIIGAPRNWSKTVIEWNLAADENFNPHTSDGGCDLCQGALTISGKIANSVSRNVSYYIIAHASKFVPQGSIRVESTIVDDLYNVTFVRPDGKKVMIVLNEKNSSANLTIKQGSNLINASLQAGSVTTIVW